MGSSCFHGTRSDGHPSVEEPPRAPPLPSSAAPSGGGGIEEPVPDMPSEPPPGHKTMEVTVPPKAPPGTVLRVRAPDGSTVDAEVPAGKRAGDSFQVHYKPDASSASSSNARGNGNHSNASNAAFNALMGNKLTNKLISKATEVTISKTGKSPEEWLEKAKQKVEKSTEEWRSKISTQLEQALSSSDESKLNTLLDSALAGSLMRSGTTPPVVRKAAVHVASRQLKSAIASSDPKQLKGALIAAKRLSATDVPEFKQAADLYKAVRKLPPGFDMSSMLLKKGAGGKFVAKLRVNDPAVMLKFQRLLDLTTRRVYTRDRLGQVVPDKLELMAVTTVTNADTWGDYMARRETIRQELAKDTEGFQQYATDTTAASTAAEEEVDADGKPTESKMLKCGPGETAAEIAAALAADFEQPLLPECNEVFLFHGTSAAAADKIATADFNINLAGTSAGTLYGRGVYLAENCTKADEYTRPQPANGHRHLLICRATLGRVFYTDEKVVDPRSCEDACLKGKFHSVLGDRKKCRGTFREFILFDEEQIYPNYILTYKRVGGHVDKHKQMEVVCPPGSGPGQTLQVQAPDGSVVHVLVPAGLNPGQKFTIQY